MITPRLRTPHAEEKTKRLLLVGFRPEQVAALQKGLGEDVLIGSIQQTDTLSREMIRLADVILINLFEGELLGFRLINVLQSVQSPALVFSTGVAPASPELVEDLKIVRHLKEPVDANYMRGVIDSAHHDRIRIDRLDEEQSRVRGLYEISSSLLKVTDRNQIAKSMETAIPPILDASLVLFSMPAKKNPLIFFHSKEPVGPMKVQALFDHLREAWGALRPDMPMEWDWLATLAKIPAESEATTSIKPSSFITTPISRGEQADGFLTVLPRTTKSSDETFLQTFFVLGDLLSVLMHNLELKEELEFRACHDGLTKLLNRQTLHDLIEKECKRSQRYGTPFSVVMMDLDHFKQVNDTHGHAAGDEVLRHTARKLMESARDTDLVGRFGGEEFVALLPGTDLHGAAKWADRFRSDFCKKPVVFEGVEIKVSTSVGVASAMGKEAVTDTILGRADHALYNAKRTGRNRVCTAQPEGSHGLDPELTGLPL